MPHRFFGQGDATNYAHLPTDKAMKSIDDFWDGL